MDWKRKILRNMTVLMFGGILLSPFVSDASDATGHGNHTIGNPGDRNHMVFSDQVHSDLDLTNVGMDDDHMTGTPVHSNNGYTGKRVETVTPKSNNRNTGASTRSGRSLDFHHENIHESTSPPTNDPYNHHIQLNGGSNYHSSSMNGGMH